MTSFVSTPRYDENDPIQKIKQHVLSNQEAYFVSATGVVAGLFLARAFGWRKPPKIDKAKIVLEWMEQTTKDGFHVYALTGQQRTLWEACWKYTHTLSAEQGWTPEEGISQVVKAYGDFIKSSPVKLSA